MPQYEYAFVEENEVHKRYARFTHHLLCNRFCTQYKIMSSITLTSCEVCLLAFLNLNEEKTLVTFVPMSNVLLFSSRCIASNLITPRIYSIQFYAKRELRGETSDCTYLLLIDIDSTCMIRVSSTYRKEAGSRGVSSK